VNLDKATYVGDYAFAYTAVVEADLASATYLGTHAFLKETMTDFTVKLGSSLADLGDNPFANCRLEAFSTTETETFNDKEYSTETLTFHISDTVRVIDGHLYRVVPNGLELVAYAGDATAVNVAEGTVRISDMAFAGAPVRQVVTPYTLKSVGHKAFFDCDKLVMLTFTAYEAPILEEAFDAQIFLGRQHIPATGTYSFSVGADGEVMDCTGLGIVPYFIWNASDMPSNLYYGANFVDYIGYTSGDLVMVRPINGHQYESFVWCQYFSAVVDGAAAADDVTLAAIAAIDALPETVSLEDKALVLAAREAYNKISTLEQRALVLVQIDAAGHVRGNLAGSKRRLQHINSSVSHGYHLALKYLLGYSGTRFRSPIMVYFASCRIPAPCEAICWASDSLPVSGTQMAAAR
jgi:hypothetical protein